MTRPDVQNPEKSMNTSFMEAPLPLVTPSSQNSLMKANRKAIVKDIDISIIALNLFLKDKYKNVDINPKKTK